MRRRNRLIRRGARPVTEMTTEMRTAMEIARARAILDAGVSRHGAVCYCRHCRPQSPAAIAEVPARPIDTRPRVNYSLPSGETVAIIFDHGEVAPPCISYLVGFEIVTAVRS